MGLLAPWFLAGTVLAGLPIYIHLLRKHSTTPQPFSSLMFFERRTQSSIKHRRLRYLLLLSLRLAVLLFLILAFANPFINRSAASMSSDKLLLVVIDNSFSMRAGSRLADARARGAGGARIQAAQRPRAGHGARFPTACAYRAHRRSRKPAGRCGERHAWGFPREFRRARERVALDGRKRAHAHRVAPVQRHAAVGHGRKFSGDGAASERHAGTASGS